MDRFRGERERTYIAASRKRCHNNFSCGSSGTSVHCNDKRIRAVTAAIYERLRQIQWASTGILKQRHDELRSEIPWTKSRGVGLRERFTQASGSLAQHKTTKMRAGSGRLSESNALKAALAQMKAMCRKQNGRSTRYRYGYSLGRTTQFQSMQPGYGFWVFACSWDEYLTFGIWCTSSLIDNDRLADSM